MGKEINSASRMHIIHIILVRNTEYKLIYCNIIHFSLLTITL